MKKKKEIILPDFSNNYGPLNPDAFVSLRHVSKIYDKKVLAVYDFNLDIKKNEFIVFVGPSGCGKSTTLRMIAGLEEITDGELYIDGVLSNELTPKERDIAMVFQSYALYPHMTVYDNMAFGLKIRRYSKEEIRQRVEKAAEILQLTEYLDRKPKALSGGQRQRVALGRAIVRHSKILLMDEPLSNLDAKLRVYMRSEIVRLHERTKSTTIYVTHDQTEAMTMADRIVVMSKGYVQQIGTPEEIYKHPANKFVAGFIGAPAMNFVDCHMRKNVLEFVDGHKVKLDESIIKWVKGYYEKQLAEWKETLPQLIEERKAQTLREWKARKHRLGRKYSFSEESDPVVSRYLKGIETIEELVKGDEYPLTFGIRPEAMKEDAKGDEYEVILSELLGDEYYVHLMFGGKECLAKISADKSILKGSKIKLGFSLDKVHLFDPISEKAIF